MRSEVQIPGEPPVVFDDAVLDTSALCDADGAAAESPLVRRCYAAGHVVMQDSYAGIAHSLIAPGSAEAIADAIDWETTLALRVRVDSYGMGIAEAMDTAQRFELGWPGAKELLERTGALNLKNGFVGAASSDQRSEIKDAGDLADALIEQVHFVRECGGLPIVLPQTWLTEGGADEDEYVRVYQRVIDGAGGPILLHWLGEVFHAGMRGYFPGNSIRRIMEYKPEVVRGLKLSLLDRALEETLRTEIAPCGQVILTGDDYNFSGLLEGTSQDAAPLVSLDERPLQGGAFSHALLGIFDTVVRPASVALRRLGEGDIEGYRAVMEPCEVLGRAIFEPAVQHYKAGIAFLAWLCGLQPNRMLANHEEDARDVEHYVRIARLASEAGVIEDAALAAARLDEFLATRPTSA